MKRSEAINFISEIILTEMYDAGLSLEGSSYYCRKNNTSLEDIILRGIEEMGMLPPNSNMNASYQEDEVFAWEEDENTSES